MELESSRERAGGVHQLWSDLVSASLGQVRGHLLLHRRDVRVDLGAVVEQRNGLRLDFGHDGGLVVDKLHVESEHYEVTDRHSV